MDSTNVETKSFYVTTDSGHYVLLQVIYSNVMGIRTTAQFSAKVFANKPGAAHVWASDNLSNFAFSKDMLDFKADGCSMVLDDAGKSYAIKSSLNKSAVVDATVTQAAPGFSVGKNGTTLFGKDFKKPWGKMIHAFWPRCRVEGTIITKEGIIDLKGHGMVSHALQGMKPHFAASRWNFVNFQSPTYSAVMMEFTTPPSYGETVVNVGGIVKDGEILFAGASPSMTAKHVEVQSDKENDWPAPSAAVFTWDGQTKDGQAAHAELDAKLGTHMDRIDVMGELPKFVKQIASGASGTKPYIYQFGTDVQLKLNVGGEEKTENGKLFNEATFIS